MAKRVFVDRVSPGAETGRALAEALEWIRWDEIVPRRGRVFFKANLTWREHLPGVTTSPAFLEALVVAAQERGTQVTIGESDGGYHSFPAEEAFASHGLYDLAKRYGIDVVNLSRVPSEVVRTEVAGREVEVELPSPLLHEYDAFVTLPVPKVHVMTRISLAYKNQWGCIPKTMRLRNHPQFDHKIVAINKLLRTRAAIYDGSYFLDRSGPMIGDPVRMDLVLASDDIGAGDLACCRIMGVDPHSIRHYKVARRAGMFPAPDDAIDYSQPIEQFRGHQFRLERALINWMALAAFRSDTLTRLIYDSSVANPIHKVLYGIRRNFLVARLLYGSVGPPAGEGGRHRL